MTRKFTPVVVDVSRPEDIAASFRALADQHVDVAIVGSGTLFAGDRPRMVQLAAELRLPTIYNEQGYVEAGGLLSYGFSRVATFTRLATFAKLILMGGRPADVPAEEISTFFLALNLTTAKSLKLSIPVTLAFRADEVIGT